MAINADGGVRISDLIEGMILFEFAAKFNHQKVFSILEGGYDHDALAKASAAHVEVLLNHS